MKNKIIALIMCMLIGAQAIAKDQGQLMHKNSTWINTLNYGYNTYFKAKMDSYSLKAKEIYKTYFPAFIQKNPKISLLFTGTFVIAGGFLLWNRYLKYLELKNNKDLNLINEIKKLNKKVSKDYPCAESFTKKLFEDTAKNFSTVMKERLEKADWIDKNDDKSSNYIQDGIVRKIVLPSDAVIAFRGDLHGDVHSLIRWLDVLRLEGWFEKDNPFRLTKESLKKHRYLAFLGDYVDRGHYGAEVMYCIMRLFLENQDNVLIVRGNHEDLLINSYEEGFIDELKKKFELGSLYEDKFYSIIAGVYECLPVAIYLGCGNSDGGVDYVLCCHGGIDLRHDSLPALLDDEKCDIYQQYTFDTRTLGDFENRLKKNTGYMQDYAKINCNTSTKNLNINCNLYQWNDFDFKNEIPNNTFYINPGRGLMLYKNFTDDLLKIATKKNSKNNVFSIFRAHQHNNTTITHIIKYGNGLYRLWSEKTTDARQWEGPQNQQWTGKEGDSIPVEKYSVWTFNVAPCTGYYEQYVRELNFDTVAELHLAKGFDNWKLYPRQIPVS